MADQQAWLEAIIKEYDRKRQVTRVISVEETDPLGAGDNYWSQVKKLVVRAARGDGEIVAESFISKQLPLGTHTRAKALLGNFTEFTCYRDVLFPMDLLLREKGITDETIWPECVTMKPYDKIVFKDLTSCGYKMSNRINGLDFEHCSLVLQNLSLFHAMSLVMNERGSLSVVAFGEHSTARNSKKYEAWIQYRFKMLLNTMEKWGDKWQPALIKMKEKLPEYGKLIISLYGAPENGFTVLNHGDVWTNNLLFKYNAYTGKPLHMKFLDFQLSFIGSPAYDLTYFLNSSPSLDVRRHHKVKLVRIYHDSLLFNMNRLGVAQKPPTLEYIESEMKRMAYLRFYLMTTLLVAITRKPEDTFDVEAIMVEMKRAAEGLEPPNNGAMMTEGDDYLLAIHQLTIKEAEDEGSL